MADVYRASHSETELPGVLLEAALAARDAGDEATARHCLEEAVARIEARRGWFPSVEMRATFYETAETVFDALIALELDARRPAAAFHYLERARIAAWGGVPGRDARGPRVAAPTLADVQRRVAPGAFAVEYAVLPDRLVVWTASRRGGRHYSVPVGRDSVAALARRFTEQLGEAKRTPRRRAPAFSSCWCGRWRES